VRQLHWPLPERETPKRPYRDSAIICAVLAVVVVVVAVATGGAVVRAIVFASAAFVLATAFSWWRWHVRLKRQADRQ
jgi:Flp pilus assembly protein TadB